MKEYTISISFYLIQKKPLGCWYSKRSIQFAETLETVIFVTRACIIFPKDLYYYIFNYYFQFKTEDELEFFLSIFQPHHHSLHNLFKKVLQDTAIFCEIVALFKTVNIYPIMVKILFRIEVKNDTKFKNEVLSISLSS